MIFHPKNRVHGECDVHGFVKHAIIPYVEAKLDSHSDMFVIINSLGALQDDWQKKYTLLGVPLQSLNAVELH